MLALWFSTGVLAKAGASPTTSTPKGDDAASRKRPIPYFRPKVEDELEDVLTLVETISDDRRVSENKKTAKEALAIVARIEPSEDYAAPIAEIQKALSKVSKNTAKHEGAKATVAAIIRDVDALISDMQAKRKAAAIAKRERQQREEEMLIQWLLNTINNLSLLPA